MKNPDNEKNDAKKDLAQTLYDAAMDDKENAGKGLHMSKRPYLWEENHITIESDNPTERFVPTPTIHTGTEGPAWKKAVKIGVLIVLGLAVLGALIGMVQDGPEFFGLQEGVGGFLG